MGKRFALTAQENTENTLSCMGHVELKQEGTTLGSYCQGSAAAAERFEHRDGDARMQTFSAASGHERIMRGP